MKKTYLIILILVLFIIMAALLKRNKISLVSVSPVANSTSADLLVPIILSFSKTIDPSLVALSSVPSQQFSVTTNQNQLTFQPQHPFLPQTTYQISVLLKHKNVYSFSFKTRQLTTAEVNNLGKDQAMSDYLYATSEAEYLQQNPFISNLPLETPEYRAVYDYGKKQIRIRILTPIINSDQKNQLVTKAVSSLKTRGVDAQKIGYYVLESEE